MAASPPSGYVSGRRIIVVLVGVFAVALFVNIVTASRNRDDFDRQHRAEILFDNPAMTSQQWTINSDGATHAARATTLATTASTASGDDPVNLIRLEMHRLLVKRRNAGDFGTRAFNGIPMPGRDELEDAIPKIDFEETEIPGGAQIRYRTDDAALRRSLEQWVQAQLDGPTTPRPRDEPSRTDATR